MSGLISVIIPVYNVELYLRRCVDSVISQSYKNLEIILVDDGSTDKSGIICDEYLDKDNRIKVLHQPNKGLSGARNSAIKMANGLFFVFVDSDDWIEKDFIELAIDELEAFDAQVFVTSLNQVYEGGKEIPGSREINTVCMSQTEAISCYMFPEYLSPCICGKVWLRSLWDNIWFPEGKLFEDQYTTYKLLERATRVVFNPISKYNYYKRDGSIGHSSFSKRTYDLYVGVNEAYDYLKEKYPLIENDLAVGKIMWNLVFINMMYLSHTNDRNVINKTICFTKKKKKSVLGCSKLNKVRKFQIVLFGYFNALYRIVYSLYKKIKRLG